MLNRPVSLGLFVLLLALLPVTIEGQEFSERQELAIFRLSYYGQPELTAPSGPYIRLDINTERFSFRFRGTGRRRWDRLFHNAFAAVDERIRDVFVNLGRFDVIGFPQRVRAEYVDEFIRAVREYRSDDAEMPEAVLLGEQAFTEDDFRTLTGGFLVVVPSVSWYDMEYDYRDNRYTARIETSFTIVDVDSGRTQSQFRIETSGRDRNPDRAVRSAVDGIPGNLEYELRSISEFQIRSGIIDREGDRIYMEFGRNMGVRLGDEYAVVSQRRSRVGYTDEVETGLIIVSEVHEQYSVGKLVYDGDGASVGDQLREVPRRGVDIRLYGGLFLNRGAPSEGAPRVLGGVAGVSVSPNRGFYNVRPMVSVEAPIVGQQGYFLVAGYAGVETIGFFRRLRVSPSVQVGAIAADRPDQDDSDRVASHVGGRTGINLSFQTSRDIMIGMELGWTQMWNTSAGAIRDLPAIQAPFVGGSLSIR
ncbi:MAG: hypothetical protein ACLFM0_03035 [Spirochaetales bacterium]